ncbi:MAG: hypothetical protein ABIF92_03290, partial [archaeon]
RSTMIVNPPGEKVEVKEYIREVAKRRISELADTDTFVEVLATVIEVFDLRFFEVCDKCGKRAKPQDTAFVCGQHGPVTPNYSYVVNVFLDDGTAAIRTVFFRDTAQKFLKKTNDEMLSFREVPEAFEQVKTEALGSFVRIAARVSKNEMFNRLELIANEVSEAKPEEAQQEIAAAAPSAPAAPAPEVPVEAEPAVETTEIEANTDSKETSA